MNLQLATMNDAMAVLEWKNDPSALAASKNTSPVSEVDHLNWFERSLKNPERDILIAWDGDVRVGTIRLDRQSDAYLVSINVAPDQRGKGYGTKMLAAAMRHGCRYVAEIRPENIASVRLFRRCGFRRVGEFGGMILMENDKTASRFDTAEIDGIQ